MSQLLAKERHASAEYSIVTAQQQEQKLPRAARDKTQKGAFCVNI